MKDLKEIKVEQEAEQSVDTSMMLDLSESLAEYNELDMKYKAICNKNIEGVLEEIVTHGLPSEQQEQNKPVEVPKFVADWILEYKADYRTPYHSMRTATELENDVGDWLHGNKTTEQDIENQEKYLQVWLTGSYTVKQEPLYYVIFPEMSKTRGNYLRRNLVDGSLTIGLNENHEYIQTRFTESEIKAKDERYWPFAVPVKEE